MPKRLLLAVTCLFAFVCSAQTVQPLFQPEQHFVDKSGNPCAGCSLYSYAAGTTTPLATYVDASGAIPNPNPIILDASGAASIWMGKSPYKFTLVDAYGTTLWTVDQVIAPFPGNEGPFLPLAGGTLTGQLALSGENIVDVGKIGLGTSTPGWPIDVQDGDINTSSGYLYKGVAPNNHVLLGNGTAYVDSASIPYSIISGTPQLFYQTVETNAVAMPQRANLNFSTDFALNTADFLTTTVQLASQSGAGSCTYCNLTVNPKGIVTAYSSNSPGINEVNSFTGCSFANDGANLTCANVVTLGTAMPDTSYTVQCTEYTAPGVGSVILGNISYAVISTSSYSVTEMTQGSSSIWPSYPNYGKSYVCTAHHS